MIMGWWYAVLILQYGVVLLLQHAIASSPATLGAAGAITNSERGSTWTDHRDSDGDGTNLWQVEVGAFLKSTLPSMTSRDTINYCNYYFIIILQCAGMLRDVCWILFLFAVVRLYYEKILLHHMRVVNTTAPTTIISESSGLTLTSNHAMIPARHVLSSPQHRLRYIIVTSLFTMLLGLHLYLKFFNNVDVTVERFERSDKVVFSWSVLVIGASQILDAVYYIETGHVDFGRYTGHTSMAYMVAIIALLFIYRLCQIGLFGELPIQGIRDPAAPIHMANWSLLFGKVAVLDGLATTIMGLSLFGYINCFVSAELYYYFVVNFDFNFKCETKRNLKITRRHSASYDVEKLTSMALIGCRDAASHLSSAPDTTFLLAIE